MNKDQSKGFSSSQGNCKLRQCSGEARAYIGDTSTKTINNIRQSIGTIMQ